MKRRHPGRERLPVKPIRTEKDVIEAGVVMAEAVWASRTWWERVFLFWRRTWYRRSCLAATSVWFTGRLVGEASLADPVFVKKVHEGAWEEYPWLAFWFERYAEMRLIGHTMGSAKSLA